MMQLSSIVLSMLILASTMPVGIAGGIYAAVLLRRWQHLRLRNYHFLINLVVSCLLTSALIVPGQMMAMLIAISGGEASGWCIVLLLFTKAISAETLVNMAIMVSYQVYMTCMKPQGPPSLPVNKILVALPWSTGVAYGIATSLMWCAPDNITRYVDPTKACRTWEMLHSDALSGDSIQGVDRTLLIFSLIAQVIGYILLVLQVRNDHQVVTPYELDWISSPEATGTKHTNVEMNETLSVGPVAHDSDTVAPLVRQSSISRTEKTSTQMQKTSTQTDKIFKRFKRSSSMHEIQTHGSGRNLCHFSRGLSDTDLRRMVPGYISDNDKLKRAEAGPLDNAGGNRYVTHWQKLQVPSKSHSSNNTSNTNDDGQTEMLKSSKKEHSQLTPSLLGVRDIKDSSESSMSLASFRTSASSNNYRSSVSPYSLRLPGSNRSGSFQSYATSISSEGMSGYFRPSNLQIGKLAWIIDGAASPTAISYHDVGTSTKELEDLLEGHLNQSQLLDVHAFPEQDLLPTSGQRNSSYVDTWRKMSSQTRSTLSNSICQDPLSTMEKIKQWRTASVDCSTIITSDLEESAFFDLCFARKSQDVTGSNAFDNIRSISQICHREGMRQEMPSNPEEEAATNMAPIEIRVVRPSATSGTLSFGNRLLKRKTGMINQIAILPEDDRARNSGSTVGSHPSIQDVCYDADAEIEGDSKKKTTTTVLSDGKTSSSLGTKTGSSLGARPKNPSQASSTGQFMTSKDSEPTSSDHMLNYSDQDNVHLSKMSQTDFGPSGGRLPPVRKLVRLNSCRNMTVTQVSNLHCPAVIHEERPMVGRVLWWMVAVLVVMATLMLPGCCYSISSGDLVQDELNTLMVLECVPFIWFAVAPFMYVIFKKEAPNSWQA